MGRPKKKVGKKFCRTKTRYSTADEAAQLLARRYKENNHSRMGIYYHCPYCNGYHIGRGKD